MNGRRRCSASRSARSCAKPAISLARCSIGAAGWSPRPTPIFDGDRVLAYIGSTIHHTDIGGYGIGAGARDVHEEGLWIPPLKLYEAGEPNVVLHDIIRRNVRT